MRDLLDLYTAAGILAFCAFAIFAVLLVAWLSRRNDEDAR